MSRRKPVKKLIRFDPVRYLANDEAIAEYIDAALEEDDLDLLLVALNDVARARGMASIAAEAGLGRESLYKTLTPGAKPRFDTIAKVIRALGVRLAVHV
jgi:probable addiction module antidote protein